MRWDVSLLMERHVSEIGRTSYILYLFKFGYGLVNIFVKAVNCFLEFHTLLYLLTIEQRLIFKDNVKQRKLWNILCDIFSFFT